MPWTHTPALTDCQEGQRCQKYAQALSRERKANALLAAEPSSKNLRGVNVSEEYATLRAIFLDSPAQVRPEMGTYEGFIGKFRRPHFSNFGPPAAPTFSNFARGVDRRPFCGGARRCGVEAAPHFSTPGAKATDFSRFGAHLYPVHFSRFDPKVPHFSVY